MVPLALILGRLGSRVPHDAVAAGSLGVVHRRIGQSDQRLEIGGVVGIDADPDAGTDVQLVPGELERCQERLQRLLRHDLRIVRALQPLDHQDELVVAEAGDGIDPADHRFQAPGDPLEQVVTELVPEAVVDVLEPVQIDEQDGKRPALAPGAQLGTLEPLAQEGPIGEAGQESRSASVTSRASDRLRAIAWRITAIS